MMTLKPFLLPSLLFLRRILVWVDSHFSFFAHVLISPPKRFFWVHSSRLIALFSELGQDRNPLSSGPRVVAHDSAVNCSLLCFGHICPFSLSASVLFSLSLLFHQKLWFLLFVLPRKHCCGNWSAITSSDTVSIIPTVSSSGTLNKLFLRYSHSVFRSSCPYFRFFISFGLPAAFWASSSELSSVPQFLQLYLIWSLNFLFQYLYFHFAIFSSLPGHFVRAFVSYFHNPIFYFLKHFIHNYFVFSVGSGFLQNLWDLSVLCSAYSIPLCVDE